MILNAAPKKAPTKKRIPVIIESNEEEFGCHDLIAGPDLPLLQIRAHFAEALAPEFPIQRRDIIRHDGFELRQLSIELSRQHIEDLDGLIGRTRSAPASTRCREMILALSCSG